AFHPPGEVHSEHFHNGEGRSFNVEASPGWLQRLRPYSIQFDQPADFQGGTLAVLALKLYREFEHMDAASPLAIEGLALEILAEATRRATPPSSRQPPWLERACSLLRD